MNVNDNEFIEMPPEDKLSDYKKVCAKLGLVMSVYFVCRILSGLISEIIFDRLSESSESGAYALAMAIIVIMVYIIPMLITAIVFKSMSYFNIRNENTKNLYKKPKRLARALGTFPAMYGLGYGLAALTLLALYLITQAAGQNTLIEDILRPNTIEQSTSLGSALMMVFMLVVIAPVFEEVWVRGIMYDALKPFGHGIAILISSILFGLMHGSVQMLFYTTALGFALGYVRYATDSLLIVTILHAMLNAIAAGMLFIIALEEITYGEIRIVNTIQSIYILAVFVLIIVGIIAFIMRIPTIKKYTIENNWQEMTPRKKTAVFFTSIPVIIMLLLAINEHTNFWLMSLLF